MSVACILVMLVIRSAPAIVRGDPRRIMLLTFHDGRQRRWAGGSNALRLARNFLAATTLVGALY
jgi:hypothetical protein